MRESRVQPGRRDRRTTPAGKLQLDILGALADYAEPVIMRSREFPSRQYRVSSLDHRSERLSPSTT
jgi:hypothetical protein